MHELQIVDCSDTGQRQCGQLRLRDDRGGRFDPLGVGVRAGPVVGPATGKSVAVRNLDFVDTGVVECFRDSRHLLGGVTMTDGVHAGAQGEVVEVDRRGPRVGCRPEVTSADDEE